MSASIGAAPLTFGTNGLYILLSDRGDTFSFHWQFYLAITPSSGIVYHLVNDYPGSPWRYEQEPSDNVADSRSVIAALQIADMDPVLHDALGQRLSEIPTTHSMRFNEQITCRVWIKEALFALDEEGYIKLIESVQEVEKEATAAAILKKQQKARVVLKSKYSQA